MDSIALLWTHGDGMLNPKVIEQMVQDQVTTMVTDQVMEVFASDAWLKPLEQRIVKHTQEYFLRKFSNIEALPEIISAVKEGVSELFLQGKIPGVKEFVNAETVSQAVNCAVEELLKSAVADLGSDPAWLDRIEIMINQSVVRQTLSTLGSMDINTIIRDRVDENVDSFVERLRDNFASNGIVDQATTTQLTLMDDHTVVENTLTARDLHIAEGAVIKDLAVLGSINIDNPSWDTLSSAIATKTLVEVENSLQAKLVEDVTNKIQTDGIEFTKVKVDGEYLVQDDTLSHKITQTNIQKLGNLDNLSVRGPASINNTFNVVTKRIGVNTEEPEMALSVWDEEVAINIGKNKEKQAYIGTSRAQGLTLGVNRVGQLTIDPDGLTTIKQLQIGLHKLSHDTQVPGWAGTRGDIVFNSNPTDSVFAWVCLGSYKWKLLKSAE